MINVLVWGTGIKFVSIVNILQYLETVGEIKVIALTGKQNCFSRAYGWNFIKKEDVKNIKYDCIMVTAEKKTSASIVKEIGDKGISLTKVIPYEALLIPGFKFKTYLEFKKRKISIIANNCWGGVTYHFLKSKFYSPFINMFIETDEQFIAMCKNLPDYLSKKLIFDRNGYNEVEKYKYPIYKLGDIKLHMKHYPNYKKAKEIWIKRLDRFNFDDSFVMMYTENPDIPYMFETIPYKKKICFTSFPTDCQSAMYINFKKYDGLVNKKFWEIVLGMASGIYPFYDPWELLLNGRIKINAE